ncbi:hypothetical protein [Methylibium petroleiphilum]|uniref:Uncharacterized protein n=1 Tax=Methylibium petroleiphilum (strain ATCC BAA-1232 / LMG 22953 / PM1) TaxID=420662 RepID=A2SNQ1_METPP|nr:hypothetical protein [Methylibium petroleiphilum]ABM97190.1 hypothetical protein Mpe_B0415 [Methylibium petroleiphilum PM1]
MKHFKPIRRGVRLDSQDGFVAAYLLFAIALFSLVAWAASQMIDANSQLRWISTTADSIYEQAQLTRKVVIDCGTTYPAGVNGDAQSLSYYKKYPGGNASLSSIQCPGAPAGQQSLLSGRDGVFLGKLSPDFTAWSYSNNSAGITISLRATSSRGVEALARVSRRIGSTESILSGDQLTFIVAAP